MPITIHRKDGGLVVELEGAVTIRHAQEVASRLTEALDSGMSISLRTARLQDVDTSILQLLCSLRKTVPELSFESLSDPFTAAVDRSGLRRELFGGLREDA